MTLLFFSLLLDGSTEKGNIDNELILLVWCDINGNDEKVHTRSDCFTTVRVEKSIAIAILINKQHMSICLHTAQLTFKDMQQRLNKWTQAKLILGCVFFVDFLTPCMRFSKSMQNDEIDILGALTDLLKTLKETDKLASKSLNQWSTYAVTVIVPRKMMEAPFTKCRGSKYILKPRATSPTTGSLGVTDLELMRDIIFMLSSHGWEKLIQEEDALAALDRLVERLTLPLQGAYANTIHYTVTKAEFGNMIEYAVQYIATSSLDYQSV